MIYCKQCGADVLDGSKFCPKCGFCIDNNLQLNSSGTSSQQSCQTSQPNAHPPETNEQDDINNNKGMAVLSYIGILVLIPLFAAKQSKFARFHASQGLTLFVINIAYTIATIIIKSILSSFLTWSMLGVYSVVSMLFSLIYLGFLAFSIIGIVNAAKGTIAPLPLIGKIDILGLFGKR